MEIALYVYGGMLLMVVIITLLVLVTALLREIKKPQVIFKQTYTSTALAPAAPEKPADKLEPPNKEDVTAIMQAMQEPPPVAYCGHCGEGIFREAVEALDVGELAVMAHDCPACRKRTLLPQETSN